MPTGYTARLEEMKYDVRRWLKESAVRALGVCVMLRDAGDMDQTEIAKRLKADAEHDDYHSKRLAEAKAEMEKVRLYGPAEWESSFMATKAKAESAYEARVAEQNRKKASHRKAMNEVAALNAKAEASGSEVIKGTLNFAMSQLEESYRFDYGSEPYREDVLKQSLAEYREATLKSLERDVQYHTVEGDKTKMRGADRHQGYQELVHFLDTEK